MVTPLAPGTTTITVITLDQGKTATCLITVKEKTIRQLEVDQQVVWLKPNRTKAIRVFAVMEDGERKEITKEKQTRYTIESSNSQKVATVSPSGVIRGKAEGEAIVAISYKEKTISVPVQVSKASVLEMKATEKEITLEQETLFSWSSSLLCPTRKQWT